MLEPIHDLRAALVAVLERTTRVSDVTVPRKYGLRPSGHSHAASAKKGMNSLRASSPPPLTSATVNKTRTAACHSHQPHPLTPGTDPSRRSNA